MRALWLEDGVLRLRRDAPPPAPPAGEATVRVLQAGICNTDVELVRGYYPYRGILGHEFVGRVECGPSHLQGASVVGEINAVCHRCVACRAGRPSHCEARTVLGIVDRPGTFADYTSLPVENLHVVPDTVADDAAVFTEPLAAALQIREQVELASDTRALVVGDGKLGLLVVQVLLLAGCDVTSLGHHPERLRAVAPAAAIITGQALATAAFDLVVECSGQAAGFAVARRAVRPRGTLVMKSTYAGELTVDASSLVVDEITVVGSRCGPFAPALRLLAEGRVVVAPMIEARYDLDDSEAAFERVTRGGALKVLLQIAVA